MKTVFMVTVGEYSDYGVVAIYSTREKAEEFMREFPNDQYNPIDEVPIDIDYAGMIAAGKTIWITHMDRVGNTLRVQDTGSVFGQCSFSIHRYKTNLPCLINWCIAASEEQAIKATNEKRTQLIANGEWD